MSMGVVACPNYEHDFDSCVFMKYVIEKKG